MMTTLEQRLDEMLVQYDDYPQVVDVLNDLKREFCNPIFTTINLPNYNRQVPTVSEEYVQMVVSEFLNNRDAFPSDTVVNQIDGFDSLDLVELVMRFEDDFGVEIDDIDAVRMAEMTFTEIVEYLKKATQGA